MDVSKAQLEKIIRYTHKLSLSGLDEETIIAQVFLDLANKK